ncbi:MAG: DUF2497 domain-containing protein [Sphingomonas adhaesiva]|uniref:DUF2497 domain-containing protein n=1 Tax=Sphingomonas adhaesiva TaxID=28212 RepID=UPI002FFBF9A7
MSAEPSMEDILASIKRVIKEGEAPGRRAAPRPLGGHGGAGDGHGAAAVGQVPERAPERAPERFPDRDRDAVLELNDALHAPTPPPVPAPPPPAPEAFAPVAPPPAAAMTEEPRVAAPAEPEEDIPVSPRTVEATRDALGALSRLVVKPDPDGDGTLEGLVREMLRPMVGEWLDRNLPRLVEQMVAREIAKITRGQG